MQPIKDQFCCDLKYRNGEQHEDPLGSGRRVSWFSRATDIKAAQLVSRSFELSVEIGQRIIRVARLE